MKQPHPRQSPLPLRVAMKNGVIAGLVAIIAIGGAVGASAATRTIETSANLEMEFWVSLPYRSVFVSTRQEGAEWITHDFRVPLNEYPGVESLLVSEPVSFFRSCDRGGGRTGAQAPARGEAASPARRGAVGARHVLHGAGDVGRASGATGDHDGAAQGDRIRPYEPRPHVRGADHDQHRA